MEFILWLLLWEGVEHLIFLTGYLASTRLPIAVNWRATKMALCVNCSSETNYICLSCNKTICNKSAECSVPADEKTPGRKMGVSVAFCLPCSKRKQGSDNLGVRAQLRNRLLRKPSSLQCHAMPRFPRHCRKNQLQAESA